MARYTFSLDEQTALALRRLALHEERTQASQLRILIRREAQAKGVWTPQQRPHVITKASR
ncbi:MAG: hypothetical protein ACK2UO_02120 [Caldilineaceae bacterium]